MNRKMIIIASGSSIIVILAIIGFSQQSRGVSGQEKTGVVEKNNFVNQEGGVAEVDIERQILALYEKAKAFKKDRRLEEAKVVYLRMLSNYPSFDHIDQVQADLEDVNMDIIFSNAKTKYAVMHKVVSGDTLGELAKEYGTTVDHIKISNHLRSDVIRIGKKLRIWNTAFNIHIDKSQNVLLLKVGGEVLKVYDVSTGKDNSTPVGAFKIVTKLVDPVWFGPGAIVSPESPENVLGSRWLGFDIAGYGIHGTVDPDTIGQQATAGCVRMRNGEVEELYSIISTGVTVKIVD